MKLLRKTAINFIYLLSFLVFLSINSVFAQETQSLNDWGLRKWQLECDESCVKNQLDQNTLQRIKDDLQKSAEWLNNLGFPAPTLELKSASKDKSETHFYEATITINGKVHGEYDIDTKELKIDTNYLNLRTDANGVASHEIFHAIQASYKNLPALFHNSNGYQWIEEGTADAVAVAWIGRKRPLKTLPKGEFNLPLNKPDDHYATSSFWYEVGQFYSSYPDTRIQYLDKLLKSISESKMFGLESVDQFFKTSLGDSRGLYELYPWFIAKHPLDHFYNIDIDKVAFSFPGGEKEVTKTISRKVRQVASDPIYLNVSVPKDFHGSLRVEILDSTDDLHLIVDRERFDSAKFDNRRNIAEFAISSAKRESPISQHINKADKQLFIRVSNIAKDITQTKDNLSYKLKLTLTPESECGKPRLSGLEMIGAPSLNENDMPPGKGVMRIGGSVSGTGVVCSDVVTGVPSLQSGVGGAVFGLGNNSPSFQLYTPGINTIDIRGTPWPYHGGVGNWKPDSRFDVSVIILDAKWEDLEEGKTYPADVKIQYMHWIGQLTETTSEGIPIRYLTGSKTQNWPTHQSRNATVKILSKRPSSDIGGGTNILVELVSKNKYRSGTFTRSNHVVKNRDDGVVYSVEESHENLDTIILYAKVDIHCISRHCKD